MAGDGTAEGEYLVVFLLPTVGDGILLITGVQIEVFAGKSICVVRIAITALFDIHDDALRSIVCMQKPQHAGAETLTAQGLFYGKIDDVCNADAVECADKADEPAVLLNGYKVADAGGIMKHVGKFTLLVDGKGALVQGFCGGKMCGRGVERGKGERKDPPWECMSVLSIHQLIR